MVPPWIALGTLGARRLRFATHLPPGIQHHPDDSLSAAWRVLTWRLPECRARTCSTLSRQSCSAGRLSRPSMRGSDAVHRERLPALDGSAGVLRDAARAAPLSLRGLREER